MKRLTLVICAVLIAAIYSSLLAQSKKETKPWVPVDSATAMKAWMEYATPGEPHKMLAKSNGTWTGEVTMWMSPDAPPNKSTSTSTNKMIMDGRYQLAEFQGNFMGMPFTGMSLTGYDNAKKVFVSAWIDNMGTGIMKMEGPWNEASKTMTLSGTVIEPSTGRECNVKETFKIVDDDTQIMEMYGPDPKTGKEYKTMSIKFIRNK
jgi:hypothetical protein